MPWRTLSTGDVVNVPDDITPEGMQRIENEYKRKTRQGRKAQQDTTTTTSAQQQGTRPNTEEEEVSRRVAARRKGGALGSSGAGFNEMFTQGLTMGNRDEMAGQVGAMVQGIPRAIANLDPSQIGREYRIGRDVERQLETDYRNESPLASMGAEILGAVTNPIGTGASVVRGLGRAASEIGLGRAARALEGTAAQMTGGPVRMAVSGGATQGALNAAGNAESVEDIPRAAAHGGVVGAGAGAVFGGGTNAIRRGAQLIRDNMPEQAGRRAMERIGQLLDNAGMTPAQVRAEIQATDAAGGDAMVMDMSPGLGGYAAAISRKPGVPRSNELIERGEQRMADRRARFGEQVERSAGLGRVDAEARLAGVEGKRKQQGDIDYGEGGPMDEPLLWNDEISQLMRSAPKETHAAMRRAYDLMALERRDPQLIGTVGNDGVMEIHPVNFRAWDYMKRGFDAEIGAAIKAGNNQVARGLSQERNRFTELLVEQNPKYAEILEGQRDLFRKAEAIRIGETAMSALTTAKGIRGLLRELKALNGKDKLDARIGIIDALMAMDNKADPVRFFQNTLRNEKQRKIFEFAFGSKKNLSDFEQWVAREARARKVDATTASGRQSITSNMQFVQDELNGGNDVMAAALRGFGYGGWTGLGSNLYAKVREYAGGLSSHVQDEIARILLSKGDDLEAGITEAAKYQRRRDRSNRRIANVFAKGGQQPFTTLVAGD